MKWPNDVWVEGRKVAGVLVEARPEEGWAVIGVGLNVAIAAEDVPAGAARDRRPRSATEASGVAGGAGAAVNSARSTTGSAAGGRDDEVLAAFRARDALAGRRISWDGGDGRGSGIDERGHLRGRDRRGETVALGAGEVHLAVER